MRREQANEVPHVFDFASGGQNTDAERVVVASRYHVQQTEWTTVLVGVVRVVERHTLPTFEGSESYSWQDVAVMDVQMIC
jgi:hypothetical protein